MAWGAGPSLRLRLRYVNTRLVHYQDADTSLHIFHKSIIQRNMIRLKTSGVRLGLSQGGRMVRPSSEAFSVRPLIHTSVALRVGNRTIDTTINRAILAIVRSLNVHRITHGSRSRVDNTCYNVNIYRYYLIGVGNQRGHHTYRAVIHSNVAIRARIGHVPRRRIL